MPTHTPTPLPRGTGCGTMTSRPHLHCVANVIAFSENVTEIFCSQDIPERRLGQQTGRAVSIFDVSD